MLTQLVEDAIISQIDVEAWTRVREVEALERTTLASLGAINWQAGTEYIIPDTGSAA